MQCEKCAKNLSSRKAVNRHQSERCLLRFVKVMNKENSYESEEIPLKLPKLLKNSETNFSVVKPLIRITNDAILISLGDGDQYYTVLSYTMTFSKVLKRSFLTKHLTEFIALNNFELFSLYAKSESGFSDTKSFNTKIVFRSVNCCLKNSNLK